MAGLIVEQLGRTGSQSVFHKVGALPLRIGRAPDNDIVIADPYVSPYHVSIEESDTGWIVIDQASTNGVYIGRGKITVPVELLSGDYIQVGRTVLRLLSPSHQVPPALQLRPQRGFSAQIITPLIAILSLIGTLAIATLDRYFDAVSETKPIALFAGALPLLFFPLFWAGIWALAGFVARRRGDYSLQLIVANGAFLLFFLIAALADYIDYFTSSVSLSDLARYAGLGILSAGLLFMNLKIAMGNVNLRRAVIALSVGGGIIAVIAVSDHAQRAENDITPLYSSTLKPPYALRAKPVSVEEFFKENEKLFGK
jgi:hypothetical protein